MGGVRAGILANEFFDASLNRVGGFGWAARRALDAMRDDPRFAVPVFFCGERLPVSGSPKVDGIRIIQYSGSRVRDCLTAWKQQIDVLLCIDFRPNYLGWLSAMPFTPAIVWVRDPRTPEDVKRLGTLRMPGSDVPPGGLPEIDFRALSRYMATHWSRRRPILLANKMAYMREKIAGTFGLPPSDRLLPNPDVVDYRATVVARSPQPTVIFLGRLDPVKRPWLFIELARRFPEVRFRMLGQPFVSGRGGWRPEALPPNVALLGNLGGEAKWAELRAAWVLVNTSIHEESAVSMLEALAHEIPVISFIESDGLSARFGTCLGYDSGTGLQSLPRLEAALRELLDDHERRTRLGRAGRQWVTHEHNTPAFLDAFASLCREARVRGFRNGGRIPVPAPAGATQPG